MRMQRERKTRKRSSGSFKKTVLTASVFLLLPSFALAGEIFGTIKEGGKPVGEGVAVEVRTRAGAYAAKTDRFGSYSVYVPETGKCKLTVRTDGGSPSIDVYSFEKSARYDLVIDRKAGELRRK